MLNFLLLAIMAIGAIVTPAIDAPVASGNFDPLTLEKTSEAGLNYGGGGGAGGSATISIYDLETTFNGNDLFGYTLSKTSEAGLNKTSEAGLNFSPFPPAGASVEWTVCLEEVAFGEFEEAAASVCLPSQTTTGWMMVTIWDNDSYNVVWNANGNGWGFEA